MERAISLEGNTYNCQFMMCVLNGRVKQQAHAEYRYQPAGHLRESAKPAPVLLMSEKTGYLTREEALPKIQKHVWIYMNRRIGQTTMNCKKIRKN